MVVPKEFAVICISDWPVSMLRSNQYKEVVFVQNLAGIRFSLQPTSLTTFDTCKQHFVSRFDPSVCRLRYMMLYEIMMIYIILGIPDIKARCH